LIDFLKYLNYLVHQLR